MLLKGYFPELYRACGPSNIFHSPYNLLVLEVRDFTILGPPVYKFEYFSLLKSSNISVVQGNIKEKYKMSHPNRTFFSTEQDKKNTGNSTENIINGFLSSLKCQSSFNQNKNDKDNKRSVITVNWEKEVENVFMDEIGKFSKQCTK